MQNKQTFGDAFHARRTPKSASSEGTKWQPRQTSYSLRQLLVSQKTSCGLAMNVVFLMLFIIFRFNMLHSVRDEQSKKVKVK